MKFTVPEYPGSLVRLANVEDNAQLLKVFGDVPMKGSLVLSTERAPDFFALYDMQGVEEVWCKVFEQDGVIEGLGTTLIREGWVGGEATRVGYLGDLRISMRSRGLLPLVYGRAYDEVREATGCDHFYTGVLASNAQALKALATRSSKRATQPRYDLLRRFDSVQVQFSRRRGAPRGGDFEVRTASGDDDKAAIVGLLAEDHQTRPFGYRYDKGEFEHRLAHWPGFELEKTYMAFDKGGALRGVCTAWDASAVKQYRVLAWKGKMKAIRAVYNAGAMLTRATPLPPPGECFRYFYLANLSVPDHDPAVLEALVGHIYADHCGLGYHFMTIYMEEGDKLDAAFRGFSVRRLPFHLYSVHRPEEPKVDYGSQMCGFEIALA